MVKFKSRNRRRNYFVNKRFQTRFILKFCLPVVLTALISAVVIYYFSGQSVTTVFENSRLTIKPGTEFILPGLILSTLISVILIGIGTMVVMLFISHSIAGPLYKIESSLERVASGDVSFDVHFRRGDEVRKLAEVFNTASRGLSRMLGDVKQEYSQLASEINELKALSEKPSLDQEALKGAIKKLEVTSGNLNEKLGKFRLREL